MLHSHTRIWVHLIWSTKNRQRVLFKGAGIPLYEHLLKKAKKENIEFEQLNIQPDYIHGLIDLSPDICLSDFMKSIKGESDHWINENRLIGGHFNWQLG